MAEAVSINENQEKALKMIVKDGQSLIKGNFDRRTISAFENRGLVKTTEKKKGIFVAATAKGKKFIN